jgi:hypothetical protein
LLKELLAATRPRGSLVLPFQSQDATKTLIQIGQRAVFRAIQTASNSNETESVNDLDFIDVELSGKYSFFKFILNNFFLNLCEQKYDQQLIRFLKIYFHLEILIKALDT